MKLLNKGPQLNFQVNGMTSKSSTIERSYAAEHNAFYIFEIGQSSAKLLVMCVSKC